MADCLATLPLGQVLAPGRYGAGTEACIGLRRVATDACALVAGPAPDAVIAQARAVLGLDLADAPRHVAAHDIEAVGIGPGRWLVLSPEAGLASRLEAALAPQASIFAQGGGLVVLEAQGAPMGAVLAKLVPLDLHPALFGPGDAATVTAAHINLTLWLTARECWRFALGRSFLAAFLRAFAAASAQFGLDWAG